jgi:N-acetylmuramic acid 6-phosphate etherase
MKSTEANSHYRHLEKMSTLELLQNINEEDKKVPAAIEKALPQIERLVEVTTDKLLSGGRLFYIGAGTSGRLGIVDASECPPTYGVPQGLVVGLIAGGDSAIRKAVEFAEDSWTQGWEDLLAYEINDKDIVVGIAASGRTPYVIGALNECKKKNIATGCITCNTESALAAAADFPVEVIVGPEFVTGSTRMKAGTAQKLVLNMLSTSVMIKIGRVEDNKMVNMQLSNEKLIDRGVKMILAQKEMSYDAAKALLLNKGSVKKALDALN